jgi:hypothetical protein
MMLILPWYAWMIVSFPAPNPGRVASGMDILKRGLIENIHVG